MPRAKTTSRRQPRQSRARSTVEIILQAGTQVLIEEGYERATTKRIAEVAGVSIGSLYQYFPGKAELVAALADLRGAQLVENLLLAAGSSGPETLETLIRALVTVFLDNYRENPTFFRRILMEAPHLREAERLSAPQRRIESLLASRMAQYADEIRPRDLDLAAFILCRSVRNTVWEALIERPEVIASKEIEVELTALALGYLRR
jgi:AcrR family transcriptional regulator